MALEISFEILSLISHGVPLGISLELSPSFPPRIPAWIPVKFYPGISSMISVLLWIFPGLFLQDSFSDFLGIFSKTSLIFLKFSSEVFPGILQRLLQDHDEDSTKNYFWNTVRNFFLDFLIDFSQNEYIDFFPGFLQRFLPRFLQSFFFFSRVLPEIPLWTLRRIHSESPSWTTSGILSGISPEIHLEMPREFLLHHFGHSFRNLTRDSLIIFYRVSFSNLSQRFLGISPKILFMIPSGILLKISSGIFAGTSLGISFGKLSVVSV